jgi:DNA-binding CsgD family transcriptional regulator
VDRNGHLIFRSAAMERLTGSPAMPLGSAPRRLNLHRDPTVQSAVNTWLSFIVSGAAARLKIRSGEIDLPRRAGGFVHCHWQYFAIPESDPDYHLLVYEPIEEELQGSAEPTGRRALCMERALFEIRSIVDGVGLPAPRRELSVVVDLATLTERELDVVKQMLDGKSNIRIAQDLYVSLETVKSHVKSIFKKLAVRSRAELLSRFVPSVGILAPLISGWS